MEPGGLYLLVKPDESRLGNAASKLWRMGYRFHGRQADEWLAKKKVEKVKRGRIVAVRDPKTIEVLELRVGYIKGRFGKLCRRDIKRPDVLAFMRSYEAVGKLEMRDRVRSIGVALSFVEANARSPASMRSHPLGEREQPEILERRVPMRGGFAPVSLGVDDRAESGEIAVFIDRGFVPAFALRADQARQDRPGKHPYERSAGRETPECRSIAFMKGFAARTRRGLEAVLVTRIRAVAEQIEHIDRLAGGNCALGGVEGFQGDFDGVHGTSRFLAAQDAR
ncbi:hypothetical protein ACQR1W_07240 [Bradyrhizobium sp. HKCCYLS1011]|uniref:hypothetical protein n=1 Tax=Bradyrhizobium sp. HKCCYLS1011 TaxID=3420733 RepID=UPI003EBDE913